MRVLGDTDHILLVHVQGPLKLAWRRRLGQEEVEVKNQVTDINKQESGGKYQDQESGGRY